MRTWLRLMASASIAGGAVFLVEHEASLRMAYLWSCIAVVAFFAALVYALRLGRTA